MRALLLALALFAGVAHGAGFFTGGASIPGSVGNGNILINSSGVIGDGGANSTIPTPTVGDLACAASGTTWQSLADVATGSVIVSGGVSTCPTYSASPTLTNVTANAHFKSAGTTPPTAGACGTSPAIGAGSSDHGITITVGTGGVATSCAVNFGVAFANAPACVAQNNTDKVAYSIVTATGTVTITATAAFTAGSKFTIVCMGI
jgi:hypothetical protein